MSAPRATRAQQIDKPDFPTRTGVAAEGVAVLIFVAMLCVFQYWLLTATLEAFHAGDRKLPLGAFIASVGCFLFAAGLTLAAEMALARQHQFLRSTRGGRASNSSIQGEKSEPAPPLAGPSPAARVQSQADAAGGGDAG
jgi:hypothetical protein